MCRQEDKSYLPLIHGEVQEGLGNHDAVQDDVENDPDKDGAVSDAHLGQLCRTSTVRTCTYVSAAGDRGMVPLVSGGGMV